MISENQRRATAQNKDSITFINDEALKASVLLSFPIPEGVKPLACGIRGWFGDELAEKENDSNEIDNGLNMIYPAIKELVVLALIAKEERCIAQGGGKC